MGRVRTLALIGAALGLGCCAGPPVSDVDPELARASSAASAAYRQGMTEQALVLYRIALERARTMDDASEIGNAAYNVGACLVELGRYADAAAPLRESERELGRAQAGLADVLLLRAKAFQLGGDDGTAVELARRVISDEASRPAPAHLVEALVIEGHAACAAADLPVARLRLERARAELPAAPGPLAGASVAGLDGRILLADRVPLAAARAFDAEAMLLRQGRRYAPMARALARAGRAYVDAEAWVDGAERLFRAARCSFADGRPEESVALCREALAAVERAVPVPAAMPAAGTEAGDLSRRIADLLAEIGASAR